MPIFIHVEKYLAIGYKAIQKANGTNSVLEVEGMASIVEDGGRSLFQRGIERKQ